MFVTAPKRIAPDVAWYRCGFANVYLIGRPGDRWVLVDTGPSGRAGEIRAAAEARFGHDPPAAIVLTHGHPDHVGNAWELAERWNTPIYAHRLELPYLTGLSPYPPPDPLTGGFFGIVSVFLSASGIDIRERLHPLPKELPALPGWRVIPTPGHSPGHVSLFRESDGTLLAGDAVATMRTDTLRAILRGKPELSEGPVAFNCDWLATAGSVRQLAALRPRVIAAGHGRPMDDPDLAGQFAAFAEQFQPPERGRYVLEPARTDENGIVSLPPPARFAWLRVAWRGLAALAGTAGAAGTVAWLLTRKKTNSR